MKQKAFLLSYTKYGDHNAVLHCFCLETGFESFFVKGIYSPKNKKKAFLFPLNELDLQVSEKKKNIRDILKIEQVHNDYFSSDIRTNSILFFVSDLLNQLLRNENQNETIYQELLMFLQELYSGNYQSHLVLMIQMLKLQGLQPLISDDDFLNPDSGNFESREVHHFFDKEIGLIWKKIIASENPYFITLDRTQKQRMLDSILVYYHHHIIEFREPKSLEIIKEIF